MGELPSFQGGKKEVAPPLCLSYGLVWRCGFANYTAPVNLEFKWNWIITSTRAVGCGHVGLVRRPELCVVRLSHETHVVNYHFVLANYFQWTGDGKYMCQLRKRRRGDFVWDDDEAREIVSLLNLSLQICDNSGSVALWGFQCDPWPWRCFGPA